MISHHLMVRVDDVLHPPPTVIIEMRCKCNLLCQERQRVDARLRNHLTHIPVLIAHHTALVVEGVHTPVLVVVVDGGQGIIIAYAVQAVGIVVVLPSVACLPMFHAAKIMFFIVTFHNL